MIIPAEEQRLLDLLPGDREAKESAWRYGNLYGRYQAMKAVTDLPSVFGLPDVERATDQDELERAISELQRADIG